MLPEKYLSTSYLKCFVFKKRNAIQVIYLLGINVKKVDGLRKNQSLSPQEQPLVELLTLSKRSKPIKNLYRKSINNFYPQNFY